MIKVGVIGYGYWGPNVVRNFHSLSDVEITSICDLRRERLNIAKSLYPHVECTMNTDCILKSSEIDVVAIITPVNTHYRFAKKALKNGKHIFVEKPFVAKTDEAKELIETARKKNLIIMVDYTYLFTNAVKKIKELLRKGEIGKLYYYDSIRINLGLFQHDVNVIWDLAPHDISIMDYLIDKKPLAVSATGASHFSKGLEDVAYLTVYFSDNLVAHFNLSWISPVKLRLTIISGEKKMLLWDDMQVDEKIKIYNKGVEIKNSDGVYKLLVSYRSGDMFSPRLEQQEALNSEISYFIDCIKNNRKPFNDGEAGLRVIKILEAANHSLRQGPKKIKL